MCTKDRLYVHQLNEERTDRMPKYNITDISLTSSGVQVNNANNARF